MKITGNKLIELGYTPAPWFKAALESLNSQEGVTEAVIKGFCDALVEASALEIIEPLSKPAPLRVYLEANNADELQNYYQVLSTMEEVLKTPFSVAGEVMPDACPAGPIGTIPVGGVVAMDNVIVPGMHSADVCCSLMVTNLGDVDMKEVMDTAFNTTHFGSSRRREGEGWESLVYDNKYLYDDLSRNFFTKDYITAATSHIGTQGDGNHFLFVGKSKKTGDVYLVTHHGSRGFGASVFKRGLAEAEKLRKKYSPNTLKQNAWLSYSDDIGQEYWDALQIVRDWTYLNHSSIHNRILDKMRVVYKDRFWNEHNFVFKSSSPEYKNLFYHAKGATPIHPSIGAGTPGDGRRIIPLNMSEPILIVKNNPNSPSIFAPHGAGRNFGRAEFQRRGNTVEKLQGEIQHLDIRFFSGMPDVSEYPSAYKNADQVRKQINQFRLCEIVDEIIPYGTIMAGEQEKFWKKK